ncbi:MAG: hypothetical protein ACRDRX_17320 [Pseudonocardiaceae bacterium]
MSDREPGSGVAVWIALRRAHRGGVATLAGAWLDSGCPVPGYVAEAWEELVRGGLLTLGEADLQSCGVRRATVTDAGSAHYVTLRRIHHPHAWVVVGTPRRWAQCPHDLRAHLLAERGPDQIGILVGVCGRVMPWSTPTSTQPTGPRCLTCQALAGQPPPAPGLATSPDSGQSGTTARTEDHRLAAGLSRLAPDAELPAASRSPFTP